MSKFGYANHLRFFIMNSDELKYDKQSPLGGGRTGNVFIGETNGKVVAVKVLPEKASGDVLFSASVCCFRLTFDYF